MSRALALDLALRRTGVCVLDGDEQRQTLIWQGVIETKGSHEASLAMIALATNAALVRFTPDVVYVEVPGRMNYNKSRALGTVIALSEAKGVVLAVCALMNVRVREIDQNIAKSMLAWNHASKESVQTGLRNLASAGLLDGYNEPHRARGGVDEDIVDAVAVGIAGLRVDWRETVMKGA